MWVVRSRRIGDGRQRPKAGRLEMFGIEAPLWEFLSRFGGAADPFGTATSTQVLETYGTPASPRSCCTSPLHAVDRTENRRCCLAGDPNFLSTYRVGIHPLHMEGSSTLPHVVNELLD
jgi:hypothetical protein